MSSQNFSTEPEPARGLDAVLPPGQDEGAQPNAAASEAHPVDKIAVRKLGGFNLITPEQWGAISAADRKELIKTNMVTFLYEGEEVPLKPALLGIRRQLQAQAEYDGVGQQPGSIQPRPADS
ncbi:MAG: hypothetical protein AAF962_19655 [Actinomycetota bacterium]